MQTATEAKREPHHPAEEPGNGTLSAVDPTALAPYDFGDDAGAGMEGARMEEQITPFLRMAQGQSPELRPEKGEYISGLAQGMIFNTATREIYPGQPGIEFVACHRDYAYGQWIPRDLGSGFRGFVPPEDPLVQQTQARMFAKYGTSARFKMPKYKDGRWSDDPARTRDTNEAIELIETGQIYVLYGPAPLTSGNFKRAVVGFTSTALAAYQSWYTRHMNQTWKQRDGSYKPAPIYAYRWRLSTFLDKRGNNEFYNWRIDLAASSGFVESLYAKDDPDLFRAAREFYELAKAGQVKVDQEAGTSREPGADEEVPF